MKNPGVSRWFIAAAFICAVPVFLPTYPPMVDLPQHVASVMVLDLVHFGEYRFAELFSFNWFRPYWFGYGLIWLLSYLVGLVWAAKLVVAVSIIGFVLALAYMRAEFRAPPVIDWLFLAVPFGFAYEWGFLNFIVCAPLGPLFLISYRRFLADQFPWWGICLWTIVLFFGHLLIVAFFCMTASVIALGNYKNFITLVKKVLPMTISIPMGFGWLLLNLEERNSLPTNWSIGWHRLTHFFPDFFSLGYEPQFILVALFLLVLPILLGARPKWTPATVLPMVFYVLFMMLTPSLIINNLGTYERFHIFGIMFYALLLADADYRPASGLPRLQPLLIALPGIVGLALVARVAIKSIGFDKEAADFNNIVLQAESGERALSLVHNPWSEFARAPVFLHHPVWYQVEHQGLVDFNFAQWTSLNSYYKPEMRSRIYDDMAWNPQGFEWQKHGAEDYRYFILKGPRAFVSHVFRNDPEKVRPVYAGDNWFLFERIESSDQ